MKLRRRVNLPTVGSLSNAGLVSTISGFMRAPNCVQQSAIRSCSSQVVQYCWL